MPAVSPVLELTLAPILLKETDWCLALAKFSCMHDRLVIRTAAGDVRYSFIT